MEDRPQGGCRQYFSSIHPKPFYRAEFGFKEGGFPVTEFAEFAESAGYTGIAIPLRGTMPSSPLPTSSVKEC